MRSILLFILLAITLSHSQSIKSLVHKYQKRDILKNASWSVYAQYVDEKEPIIDQNGSRALVPASGLKLFTTAAALDILGSDFQFKTYLYYKGVIKDGVLNGDVFIVGGGDPTLGSERVEGSMPLADVMQAWRLALVKKGIKAINGSVQAVTDLYDEQAVPGYWFWTDIGNYYGAGSYALNMYDNLYYLYFKPASKVGEIAKVLRTKPKIEGLTFNNYMKTGKKGSGDNGYIFLAPKQYLATLRGTIPAGKREFDIKGAMPDPPLFAAQHLTKYLKKSGIKVKEKASVTRKNLNLKPQNRLHTITSPKLSAIVTYVNKRSFNLYSEGIGKMAGFKLFGSGSNKNARKAIDAFLERQDVYPEGLDLYDVCGLSASNTISAKLMSQMLLAMAKHKEFKTFYNSMAVAGDPKDIGFFKRFGAGTAIEKNARIKSGLINKVRSHSGYVNDKNGRLIAFSFIANNFDGRVKEINNIHKKLLIALAKMK